LIRNKNKTIVHFEWNCLWEVGCHCISKEMPIILVNRAVDQKRIIGKRWAEEEERHKGLLTPPLKKEENSRQNVYYLRNCAFLLGFRCLVYGQRSSVSLRSSFVLRLSFVFIPKIELSCKASLRCRLELRSHP
jgi:hypothetical protein